MSKNRIRHRAELAHHLLAAGKVAVSLIEQGLHVDSISLRGRWPRIWLRDCPGQRVRLDGARRYAWGLDAGGRYERYSAMEGDVQICWEVRH